MGKGLGDALGGTFRNDVFGTTAQAQSAQNAALAQQRTAADQQRAATGYATQYGDSLNSLAAMTPQEMQAYNQSLQSATTQVQQQQKILDSIDPSIMEASKQVLSVLQGGQTGIGNAMGAQRNQQRAQLVNSLRAQYGPGAESSSIGQRQLQAFDRDTASLGAQGQGNTLAQLMGVVQGRPNLNGALGALNQAGQNFGGIQNRMLGAREQGGNAYLGALMGTNQGILNSAGADQTKDLITSGAQRAFWDNWSQSSMRFGESMAGMGMGKSGGGGGTQSADPNKPLVGDQSMGTTYNQASPQWGQSTAM